MTAQPVLRCLPRVVLLSAVLLGGAEGAGAVRGSERNLLTTGNGNSVRSPLVLLPGKPQKWTALLTPHSPQEQHLGGSCPF